MANDPIKQGELYFPSLARGWDPLAPLGSMTPDGDGPMWRELQNFRPHDGALLTRPNLIPAADAWNQFDATFPSISYNYDFWAGSPDGAMYESVNGQVPCWIFSDFTLTRSYFGPYDMPTGRALLIVVTSREIWICSPIDGVWYNMTPTISGGTVDYSNATKLVTANTPNNPNWFSKRVGAGSLIQFGGAGSWYPVSAPTDGPPATLLVSGAGPGVNKTNVAYSIRRVFGGRNSPHPNNVMFAALYNGDLYLAGSNLSGSYYNISASIPVACGPAVIRVRDVYGSTMTSEYLMANVDLTGAMSANSLLADVQMIVGMQMLQDGRMALLCNEQNSPKSAPSVARIRWCNNADQAKWTQTSGGGFVDLVPGGQATALGLVQGALTVHYPGSIVRGALTGQTTTYPISWGEMAAEVGAIAPRTVVPYRGGELYFGSDYNLRYFNGSTSQIIESPARWMLKDYEKSHLWSNAWGSYNPVRDEYTLWMPYGHAPAPSNVTCSVDPKLNEYGGGTYTLTVNLGSGLAWASLFPVAITAADTSTAGGPADADDGNGRASQVIGALRRGYLVGVPSTNALGFGMSCFLTEERHRLPAPERETSYSSFAETDWQDMGLPGIEKTISSVMLWTSADVTTDQSHAWTVTVTNGEGSTASQTKTLPAAYGKDQQTMFSFAPLSGERWKVKIAPSPDTAGAPGVRLVRMMVKYQVGGESEAARDLTR